MLKIELTSPAATNFIVAGAVGVLKRDPSSFLSKSTTLKRTGPVSGGLRRFLFSSRRQAAAAARLYQRA
jgi:hypothetical protein